MTLINTKNPKSEFDFQAILIGNNKNILQLGNYPSDFSNFVKDNDCNVTIVNDDNDFFESYGNKKFDIILLGNIIENKVDHTNFLKKLSSMLETDGYVVSSVSNISYITNRIQFLNNEFNFPENIFHHFNLNSLLLTLLDSSFSLKKLIRIKKNPDILHETSVKYYTISEELTKSILEDPESTTINYVFSAIPVKNTNYKFKKWAMQFTKDIVSERLKEMAQYQNEHVVKVLKDREVDFLSKISSLESLLKENNISVSDENMTKIQTIIDAKDEIIFHHENALNEKDEIIFHHENALKEKDDILQHHENALNEKNEIILHHENALKEKDDILQHHEQAISDYKLVIKEIRNSKTWKIINKFTKSDD